MRTPLQILTAANVTLAVFISMVFVNEGLAQSSPLDYQWADVTPAGSAGIFHEIERDIRNQDTLMAATDSGVLRSLNNGASWRKMNVGLSFLSIAGIEQDPRIEHQNTWYLLTRHSALERPGRGVYRSDDNGSTWVRTSMITTSTSTVLGGDILVDGGSGNVIVSALTGVFVSQDRGETWTRTLGIRDPYFFPSVIETGFGLLASYTTDISFDHGSFSLSASPPAYGFYLSQDNGGTWTYLDSAESFQDIAPLSMAIDPDSPETVYAYGSFRPANLQAPAPRYRVFEINLATQEVVRLDLTDLNPRLVAAANWKNGFLVGEDRLYLGGSRLVFAENGSLREPAETLSGFVKTILPQSASSDEIILAAGIEGMAFINSSEETLVRPLGPQSGSLSYSATQPPSANDPRIVSGDLLFSAGPARAGSAVRIGGDQTAVSRLATWLDDRYILGSGRDGNMILDLVDTVQRSLTRLPLPIRGVQVIADPQTRTALAFGREGVYRHPSLDNLVAYAQEFGSDHSLAAGWVETNVTAGVYQPINSAVLIGVDDYLILAGKRVGTGISAIRIQSGDMTVSSVPDFGDRDGVRSLSTDSQNTERLVAIVGQFESEALLGDYNRVSEASVWESRDGGLNWETIPTDFSSTEFAESNPVLQTAVPFGEDVLLGTSNGLFWLTNNETLAVSPEVIGQPDIVNVLIREPDGRIVIGTESSGVYVGHAQAPIGNPVNSGLYFDPGRAGHGYSIRQFVDGSTGSYLFTYNDAGESEWLLSIGSEADGVIHADQSGPLRYVMANGQTAPEPVVFADFLWDQTDLTREIECDSSKVAHAETVIDGTLTSWCVGALLNGDHAASGVWFAGEADSGWGLTVDIQDSVAVVIAYLYDSTGRPVWLLGQTDAWADGATITMNRYEGYCRECPPTPLTVTEVGTLSLTPDGENLILDMDVTAGAANPRPWQRFDTRLVRLGL